MAMSMAMRKAMRKATRKKLNGTMRNMCLAMTGTELMVMVGAEDVVVTEVNVTEDVLVAEDAVVAEDVLVAEDAVGVIVEDELSYPQDNLNAQNVISDQCSRD